MLKVTRGPGEDASTRTSGKSSTSPILELWTQVERHKQNNINKGYNAIHQTTSKMLLIRIISNKFYSFILLQSSRFSISNSLTESQLFKYRSPINSEISA